jgi:myo-inositol-1(or 4)-monophosphatase
MGWDAELTLAARAAAEAAAYLKETFGPQQEVLRRDRRDVKLEADVRAERAILDVLRGTGLPVLAEESGETGDVRKDAAFWVVDPLDGTANFSRGIPGCAVSIALCSEGEPVLGVIHDFVLDEVFAGEVGRTATLNGVPMRVSTPREPAGAIFATGFPKNFTYSEEELHRMFGQLEQFHKVRMIGTAALALAYVAAGRFDAYAERRTLLWDFAAGVALIRAAGGVAEVDPIPGEDWMCSVRCAATPELLDAIR